MTPLVIKVGGALLSDASACRALFNVLADLQKQRPVVLVHGGGVLTDSWLTQLGLTSDKVEGVRVTPHNHLPFVIGALAGQANKQLVSTAYVCGLKPVGLSLADGPIAIASIDNPALGAVGMTRPNDTYILTLLLDGGALPIISSIAMTEDGQLCNVNADDAAVTVAQALTAELVLLSDVTSVLDATGQRLPSLTANDIVQLQEDGVIHGGMIVKVQAALKAATSIGQCVYIASWRTPHDLLELGINSASGTAILPEEFPL